MPDTPRNLDAERKMLDQIDRLVRKHVEQRRARGAITMPVKNKFRSRLTKLKS